MKCTYCGAATPENANFCMGCGRPLTPAKPLHATVSTASPAQNRSTAKWLGIGVGVLLLMALAFVIGTQSGLLTQANVKKPEGPSVLEAQPPKVEGPSVLEAQPPKIEGPSVVQSESPKPPPKHVVDWLEHLRRTEERRQRMERNVAPVMSMLVQAMVARAAAMSGANSGASGGGTRARSAAPAASASPAARAARALARARLVVSRTSSVSWARSAGGQRGSSTAWIQACVLSVG